MKSSVETQMSSRMMDYNSRSSSERDEKQKRDDDLLKEAASRLAQNLKTVNVARLEV